MKELFVGRSNENNVVISNPYVGRRHCKLIYNDDGSFAIEDLQSRNGTYVNGRKIRGTVKLKAGDVVKLANEVVLKWADYFKNEDSSKNPVDPTPTPSITPSPAPLSPDQNPMLYNCNKKPDEVYGVFEKQMLDIMETYKSNCLLPEIAVSPTHYSCDVISLAVNEYRKNFSDFVQMARKVEDKYSLMKAEYDDDMQKLDNLYQYTLISNRDVNAGMNTIRLVNEKKTLTQNLYLRLKDKVLSEMKHISMIFEDKHPSLYPHKYEMALASDNCWRALERADSDFQNVLYVGDSCSIFNMFEESLQMCKREYQPFLISTNLLFYYNGKTKRQCEEVVNSIAGRLLMSLPSGAVKIYMVDANDLEGTCSEFKGLNRDVFKIYAQSTEINKLLEETLQHIENVLQNMLVGTNLTLADYNSGKTNKEPYRLLIIKDFPCGFYGEAVPLLKKIVSAGIRAGVSVMFMMNDDEINMSDDSLKAYRIINPEYIEEYCAKYSFITSEFPCGKSSAKWKMNFEMLSENILYDIVRVVNKGFEIKTESVFYLTDYLPNQKEWWTGRSASMVEIPFGISSNKAITQLRITQESGQNSAVVIGIPGSGKSVFLHSIILDAAIKYSPRELQMYLLDFSGVEFNVYATHKLPHARVIAPEAEREFGLSVLRELREEGVRRMNLCRDNDVTNIVELRKKDETLVMPRIMVIIDEFQKIFEVENDAISREANSIIHIIIQEYRKFGINLILATQRVPSSYVLPKDLIANRIVFKSTPNDFSALIDWQYGVALPALKTGQCIYNAESGASFANVLSQGFFVPKRDIDKLLGDLKEKAIPAGTDNSDLLVFRGNDLPDIGRIAMPQEFSFKYSIPEIVPAFLGQSIAISDSDVYVALQKESSNNILIVGGEKDVAQKIALYATLTTTIPHENESANYYLFNFMRPTDPQFSMLSEYFDNVMFNVNYVEKIADVKEILTNIKEEIDARKQDENRDLSHIYLAFFAFQLARIFDRGGRRGDDVSEEGQLLDYIIKQGPAMGVFTILQVDKLEGLTRIGTSLSYFIHRVLMQMPEPESVKLMDSSLASKLYVMNRPSSKYRAFYRDQNRNITIKFKPYK